MSRVSAVSVQIKQRARIGIVVAIAITSMVCPISAAPDQGASNASTDLPRFRVFAEDADFGTGTLMPDDEFYAITIPNTQREAAPQVIIAPLPPAALTGLPLLGGMWVALRYRTWRRRG